MDRESYRKLIETEQFFRSWPIQDGTWLVEVRDREKDLTCQCYLLEGETAAVAIDSGCGGPDLYAYMSGLTPLPVLGVINTHSHFDHLAGNRFFPRVYLNEKVLSAGQTAPDGSIRFLDPAGTAFWQIGGPGGMKREDVTFLKEGDTLDLGGRALEVLEIGAHDLASIALLDGSRRLLFTGDEVETGWCNVGSMRQARWATIENHHRCMQKLKAREAEFDWICPGHHGAPIAKQCLDHQLICDQKILAGEEGSDEIPFAVAMGMERPGTRILRYQTAHRGYAVDCIWDNQVEQE